MVPMCCNLWQCKSLWPTGLDTWHSNTNISSILLNAKVRGNVFNLLNLFFSLIAAAVTYIMGKNVGRGRIFLKQKKLNGTHSKSCTMASVGDHSLRSTWSVDCGGASKGLFLGILCLVAGIVVIIIFLVVKEDEEFPADTIFWLTTGALSAVLGLCCIMTGVGLFQIRKLSSSGQEPTSLDTLLSTVSTAGVQLYAVFGIVVGASGLNVRDATDTTAPRRHAMLLSVSLLQIMQVTLQSVLLAEALRRATLTRHQMLTKPARQVVTFLLCSNAVLWAYDTFVTQSWMSQELQLRFFGVLAWGVISRIGLPLLVFYRFHSCVLLLEVWKRSYRTPLLDPGNWRWWEQWRRRHGSTNLIKEFPLTCIHHLSDHVPSPSKRGIVKKVTLADLGSTVRGCKPPKSLCVSEYPYIHGYSAESGYLKPHDSISWMYLDHSMALEPSGPMIVDLEYALPPPRRKKHHHHHGHHHRSNHERSSSHNSSCIVTECIDSHVFPTHDIFELVRTANSGNTPFRKVPWHSNLHMLKFWCMWHLGIFTFIDINYFFLN